MNSASAQGPNAPGRIGFGAGRNTAPTGMNYHAGNNSGAGYAGGGYGSSSGMPYNSMGNGLLGANNSNLNSNNAQLPYGHASQHTTPTHSPYSSSPSSSAYPNSSKSHPSSPLRRYILLPPPRKKKLHRTSDLGFPGVFPQKPGQDEDQMTFNNVKTGYIDKGIIQNETVSAQGILADGLQDPKKLHDLGAFMVEVLKKRQESSKITGPSTFRPPSRATLNDQKKEQWMTDLSGTTSLRRLSKSVPHGFKSEKLLEALAQRQVPMLRATWYIKIVALSEMQAQRSRPSSTQNQYSTDWTMTVHMFLKKQLLEINPQSTTKPAASALNPASGSQNVKPWASEEAKEKWEAKWRYSVMLTKWQYNEGLLDHRHFLRATVEQISTLSFEQVALLLSLIAMFLSEYARSRLLMRLLIESLLNTLQLVQNHPSYNQTFFRYSYLELELKRMLQAWSTHPALLEEVLLKDVQSSPHKPAVFPNVGSVLESYFKMIQARVRVFTDLTSPGSDVDSKSTRQGSNVEILDKVDHFSDLEEVAHNYFSDSTDGLPGTASIPSSPSKPAFSPLPTSTVLSLATPGEAASHAPSVLQYPSSQTSLSQRLDAVWKSRVNTLCEWAITNSRYGPHRVYLVGTLLNIWLESPRLSMHIPAHERPPRLQAALLEFLDSFNGSHHHSSTHSQAAAHSHQQQHHHHHHHHHHHGQEDTLDAVARLYGNLIHDHLFSYQQYLQRLIARGDLQPSKRGQESTLRHLKYLQSFPLHKGALRHHLNQRRVVLFGVNGEDEYDRECFDTITAQIKAKLPHMFSPEAANMTVPIKDSAQDGQELSSSIPFQLTELILSASRFCQLRITSQWLLDAVKSYVVKHIQIGEDNWRVMTSPGSSLLNGRQFATIVCVMEVAGDFHSLFELCTWLLEHTLDKTLLTYIVNLAKKHYMVWAAMGTMTKFSQAILAKHYSLQSKSISLKALPRYLAFEAYNVPEDIRTQMEVDLISPKTTIAAGITIPAQIHELQHLLKDTSSTAVSNLASSLHFKYGGLSEWPRRLFEGCIDALQKQDANARSAAAMDTDASVGSLVRLSASQEIIRASKLYVELLVETLERVGNGTLDEVVLSWPRLRDMEWMTTHLGVSSVHDGDAIHGDDNSHLVWFLSFMAQLVIQGVCSIEILVQNLCGALLNKVACSIQPSPQSSPHADDSSQQAIPEEAVLNLCKTLVRLLRLLLIEDASTNPRTHQPYGTSHLAISAGHSLDQSGIRLTIAEVHALQTQRYANLVAMHKRKPHQERTSAVDGSTESSAASLLLQEEHRKMMLTQFKICRDLVWIEACLPLNHKALHEIQEYRKDWALSADWLREKCQMDVDGAYKMFLQAREEQQQQLQQAGVSGAKGPGALGDKGSNSVNRKHLEIVDRRMMEAFQMLVAESHESLLLMDTAYGETTTMTVHQRTLRSIFSRVDRWIFDRCKVEFWLLLDNVMMERAASLRDDKHSEKVLNNAGQGDASSSSAMLMEGVAMTSDPTISSQLHSHHHQGEGDALQVLIHIFFQEFVLSETADKELLGRMLVGMRNDVVEEFIRYGYSVLAGHSNTTFPYNVMIVQRPVSSADYITIVANFHYVMEILMNERQPGIVLSSNSDEPSSQATATPSASTPAASSASNNNGYVNPAASALEGLDAAQLESRIGFAKSLLWQLKKFEDRIRVFDVMQAIGCSFEDAAKVVQEKEAGAVDFEDLLLNASASMQQRDHQQGATFSSSIPARDNGYNIGSSGKSTVSVHLIDLRTSLCLRLRLLVPLLPVILQHPSSTACDLATYVIRLTNLLVSSIVHGHGSEERLFEFCLDMVSCLMDEVLLLSGGLSGGGADSKAIRNDILNQLRTGLPQMTTSIPTVFASRIFRILPFQQHNVYFTSLRVAGETSNGLRAPVQHKEIQPRPWDWLEDCVGDLEQNPNQQQHNPLQQPQVSSQSPALGLGLYDAAQSNGDAAGGNLLSGSASSLVSGSSSSLASSAVAAAAHENANDTSISLTFFGAKQVRKSAEGTTYQTQFKLGHGGGDDEMELLMAEEQLRPCEYNHTHQQQLLILQHQQRQQQLQFQQQQRQQQQQQQQQHLQQQQDLMMESVTEGANSLNDGSAGQQLSLMEVDLFGHPASSSTGGIRSGSVPPLPRVQEPDPELEEGQILNDEDLDLNSMTMSWENGQQQGQQPGMSAASTGGRQPGVSASTMEDGEVIEIKDDEFANSAAASSAASIPAVAVPPASAGTTAPSTTAAGKKRSNTGLKAGRVVTTATTTAPTAPSAAAPATATKATKGKGSRSSKGSKAAQPTAANAGPTGESGSADASSSSSMPSSTIGTASSFAAPSAPMQTGVANIALPPAQQQQQFQPLQHPQYQNFQAQAQQFPQHMRTSGGPMTNSLPGQGQHPQQAQQQQQQQQQQPQLTSHQLMNIMRQSQNAAAAAMAASSGSGVTTTTTTMGGIHVPALNGQQQFQQQHLQQQQQQPQYMDPSAFLNNGGNNGNNGNNQQQAFNPGNPMNINLGQFNNNNHQGWQ
ncbi:RNA polymerase II mediator complex subunit [Mortierella alpina]|nr:RNA polymerase II mediator complex subunit [Mortierella alpina]